MRLSRATDVGHGSRIARHAAGILAILFGSAALLAGFWTQFGAHRELVGWTDLRVVLPLGGVALAAGIVSLVRREPRSGLAIGGMAMALAAPVLGWVVLVAAVAAAALAVMLIIAKFH